MSALDIHGPIRRSPFTAVLLGLAAATPILLVSDALARQERTQVRSLVRQEAVGLRAELRQTLETHTLALGRVATLQELQLQRNGWFSRQALEPFAGLLVRDYPELRAIALIDRWERPQFVVPATLEPTPGSRPEPLADRLLEGLGTARSARKATLISLDDEQIGGDGSFAIAVPVYLHDEYRGTVLGLFRSRELFGPLLTSRASNGVLAGLATDDQPAVSPYGTRMTQDWAAEYRWELGLGLPGAGWTLVVQPTRAVLKRHLTLLPVQVLALGLVCASLLSAAIRHRQMPFLSQPRELRARAVSRTAGCVLRPSRCRPKVPDELATLSPLADALGPESRLSPDLRQQLEESRREILLARNR